MPCYSLLAFESYFSALYNRFHNSSIVVELNKIKKGKREKNLVKGMDEKKKKNIKKAEQCSHIINSYFNF